MKRNVKITLYAVLLVLIMIFAPALVFAFVPLSLWAGVALLSVGTVYVLVCITVNCIKNKKLIKDLLETPMAAWQTQFEKRREEIQSSMKEAVEKLNRLLRTVVLYNVSLIIAFLCISSGLVIVMRATIPFSEDFTVTDFYLIAIVICAYLFIFYMPMTVTLFRSAPKTSAPFFQRPLPEQDYLLLYGIAQKSAQAVGYTGRFRLLPSEENGVSVAEENGTVSISLPPALLPLLTENELYAVLIHEFAHALHADTRLLEKCSNLNYRYGERTGFGKIATAFFSYAGSLIGRETDLVLNYSCIVREQSADGEVKKHADAQAFMDATAKAYLFDEVFREPIEQFTYSLYETENPPENYYEQRAEYFEKHAREIYPHALEIMMRRLPARNDTHPTFKMRAESFGIYEFDPFRLPEGAFREETLKFTKACGQKLYHILLPQWKYMHEENFETSKEVIDRYETNPDSATEAMKLLAMDAYRGIGYDRALALAEKILNEDEGYTSAKFTKAFILCVRDREEGMPLLIESIREDLNLADAFELYSDTVLRTGKQELLDELRKMQAPFGQEIVDKIKRRLKEDKVRCAHLVPCTKDERYEKIAKSVLDIAQSVLKGVYLCEDVRQSNGRKIFVFLPIPADERAQRAAQNIRQYFSLLWRKGEEYYTYFGKPTDRLFRRAKKQGVKIV